ncbi:MAG: ATP-binding protein [Spirochaetes bacterium]|nr:ATP-binding protein [Spirochaetota bacterium]
MNNIMELFIKDSRNHINQLVDSLIQFKKEPKNQSVIEDAFRAAHSIKSEASYLQLNDVTSLSHEIETELENIRTKKSSFSKKKYNSLTKKIEILQEMIEAAAAEASSAGVEAASQESPQEPVPPHGVLYKVQTLQSRSEEKTNPNNSLYEDKVPADTDKKSGSKEESDSEGRKENKIRGKRTFSYMKEKTDEQVFNEFQLYLLSEAMKRGEKLYRITCDILPEAAMKYVRLYLIVNNLELHCNLIKTIPVIDVSKILNSGDKNTYEPVQQDPDMEESTKITCYVTTDKNYDQIYNIINVDEVKNIQIINISYESYFGNEFHREFLENIISSSKTISVKADRLDTLFTSIHKMRMEVNLKSDYLDKEAASILDRNLETMEDSISRLRMATLSDEFASMSFLINKIAFDKGKEAEIFFDDNDIEIDRAVFEYIYDPIIHLFRNAIDHGIETVEERIAKGKNPKGKIECKTYLESSGSAERAQNSWFASGKSNQQGSEESYPTNNSLIIKISDDGKGMEFDKIAEKSGLTSAELRKSNNLFSVISAPGFTTKEYADEHSGRGFGMNLVKEKLLQIKGTSLEIDSKEDEGTVFTIKLSDKYVAKNILYLLSNGEIIVIPADIIEEIVESLTDADKTDFNKIMYKEIPVCTREGLLFAGNIKNFEKFKGVVINKNNKKALIICEKILFRESIPSDRFHLIKTSFPYLFLMKIAGLDTEYYYLEDLPL